MQRCIGRRPVLILSTLICCGSSIWRSQAHSYSSFMGACVLNGIGAGPAETAQPEIIADVMFLHDRGKYQTLYFYFYSGYSPSAIFSCWDYHGRNKTRFPIDTVAFLLSQTLSSLNSS